MSLFPQQAIDQIEKNKKRKDKPIFGGGGRPENNVIPVDTKRINGTTSTSGTSKTYTVNGITYNTATGRPIDPETGNNLLDVENKTKKEKKSSTYKGTTLKGENLKRTYRDRGGVLRYPYEALTERTDYLQIDINQYESARERSGNQDNLIGRVGTRRLSTRGRRPNGLTTKSLVNKGTILLQIPSQVQDGNSVSYGDSK